MPTTQTTAQPLPLRGAPIGELLAASISNTANTMQFDLTGHPATSVSCGEVDGLPVGTMVVGRRWEEDLLLRTAHAFETTGAWT